MQAVQLVLAWGVAFSIVAVSTFLFIWAQR